MYDDNLANPTSRCSGVCIALYFQNKKTNENEIL